VGAILDVLLDNAHEALERGGRVSIVARVVRPQAEEIREAWGRMGPGNFVKLEVSDTGPGIGPEAQARLFRQPFFTTKPRHHGLGLIIAHSIVSSQEGGICVRDNPGGGLSVAVYLPVHTAAAAGVPARRSVP
jgi:signal transduction histidine kinase